MEGSESIKERPHGCCSGHSRPSLARDNYPGRVRRESVPLGLPEGERQVILDEPLMQPTLPNLGSEPTIHANENRPNVNTNLGKDNPNALMRSILAHMKAHERKTNKRFNALTSAYTVLHDQPNAQPHRAVTDGNTSQHHNNAKAGTTQLNLDTDG